MKKYGKKKNMDGWVDAGPESCPLGSQSHTPPSLYNILASITY